MARYASVAWVGLASGTKVGSGPVTLSAVLNLSSGRTRNDPAVLAVRRDGGTVGSLSRADAGYYLGQWTAAEEGQWPLVASHVDAGITSSVLVVQVDRTGPAFTVVVPSPPARPDGGPALSTIDALSPNAWRRDEKVLVQVSSAANDVDSGTVVLSVSGSDGGGVGPLPVQPSTGCGQAYCGTVEVELARPVLDAFRGSFAIKVGGHDDVGNAGSGSGAVSVTRWNWSFEAPTSAPIKTSPAIGSKGTLYFGTSSGNTGLLYSLNPDGTVKWTFDAGSIEASPAVGVSDGGVEVIFVAGTAGAVPALHALDSSGGLLHSCSAGSGTVSGSLAVATLEFGSEVLLSGVGVINSGTGRLTAIRPGAVLPGDRCGTQLGSGFVEFRGGVVTNGTDFFFAQGSGSTDIKGYSFSGGNWALKPGWPAQLMFFSRTPALVGGRLVGAGGGGLSDGVALAVEMDGGTSWRYSVAGSSPVPNFASPVVAGGGVLVAGTEDGRLRRVAIGSSVDVSVLTDGPVGGALALGQGDLAYSASRTGTLETWRKDLTLAWSVSGLASTLEASPALDCKRDGQGSSVVGARTGILYLASTSPGRLYSFVVDSKGIDPSAPWPKYQHDPRNTGNAGTPLAEFLCP